MRLLSLLLLIPFLAAAPAGAEAPGLPAVGERRLANGVRVLTVERPGSGALHVRLLLRGGRADTGTLPPVAAELLARTLLGPALPEDLGNGAALDPLLKREEAAWEARRLEGLRRIRGGGSGDAEGVAELVRQARAALDARLASGPDAFDALGASRRSCTAEADYLEEALDLPAERFEAWCGLAAERLRILQLGRFPAERDRLLAELGGEASQARAALSVLLGTAFPTHPYGAEASLSKAAIQALTWSELRAYARWAVSPERLVLVLVGDVARAHALPALERSFGSLPAAPEGAGRREATGPMLPEASGARRLQACMTGSARLYMAWLVPPLAHPDGPQLQVLAAMLGGNREARLPRRLLAEGGPARDLKLRLHVPGGRDVGLLALEALPAQGRGLAELEQAALGEMLRPQTQPFGQEEIRRAQRLVEQELLRAQEDAGSLAHLLGAATCEGGDWRLPFRLLGLGRDVTPEELQGAARRHLASQQLVVALLEPDPLLTPQDAQEGRLVKALEALLAPRLPDRARLEAVVREAVRQLRMLGVAEREATLRLLEAQVKP